LEPEAQEDVMSDDAAQTASATGAGQDPVTVIGLGAMGRALAGAFVDGGHPTTVWNRSAGKGEGLAERGATVAGTITEALVASSLIIVCLVDDAARQELLDPLGDTLAGRAVVNLSSDTPERARNAAAWATRHDVDYLDGAIMVPTDVIGTPDAVILLSGARDVFDAHRQTLQTLAGNLHYLGSDPGAAALHDLAMLDIFYTTMAGIVHAFALVQSDGVAPTAFVPFAGQIVEILPPIIDTLAAAVEAGQHPGDVDRLQMEVTGMEHIIESSRARGLDVSVLDAVKTLGNRAIAAGHGDDSFSSIVSMLRGSGS
jgi:3-hydroxyisobutyrate dehydrogenase-like beta-hydroxyacid dehydrogenase